MGTRYSSQAASGYNSSPPADDGTQVASNLITWTGVKTKLADPIKTLADAENTALVTALDLSARAISSPDTAIASDHWKTLQVTGSTTVTLSSAASMGAGYEVGIFNAGTGVVTVTPGNAADTINGVSASVTVSIKGTKIFRTNQALTGYNIVGGYDPQTVTASTSVVTPLVTVSGSVNSGGASAVSGVGLTTKGIDGATSYIAQQISSGTSGNGAFTQYSDGVTFNTAIGADPTTGDFSLYDGRFPGTAGTKRFSISRTTGAVFTPVIDTGTTGSGTLKTNNGTTVLTWDNNGAIAIGGRASPASGVGVAFPAAQSASTDVNTLDDYEEGTWTPVLRFGGASVGITYVLQSGTYTKIGRAVHAHCLIQLTSKGSSVGTATIAGLPFTVGGPTSGNAVAACRWSNMTSSFVYASASAAQGGTIISLEGITAAATTSTTVQTDATWGGTGYVEFWLEYEV